jgi:hypothetical protein
LNVLHDIAYLAFQNSAQVIDRSGVEGFVLSQLINGGTGNMMVFYQGVGGFRRSLKRLPERTVTDHGKSSIDSIILSYDADFLLTMVWKKTILFL